MSDRHERRLRELEEELRALRAFESAPYRAVIEDMTELVVRWKPDGTRVFVNDAYCRLFGMTRDEVIGTSFWPLISELDRALVRERIARLSPERPVNTGRHRAIGPDGTLIWMEWSDRALFDEDGTIVELQSVGRNIDDRIQLERQLLLVERADAVARNSAAIAHDLAGIFQVLGAQLEIDDPARTREGTRTMAAALERGCEMLERLRELRYGRVLRPAPVDLDRHVAEILPLFAETTGSRVRLHADLGAAHRTLAGDATQIDQVLMNLVRNAIDAAPDGSRIAVSTDVVPGRRLHADHRGADREVREWVLLRVCDEGPGVPRANRARIFEPHVTTKPRGQGLGLATVKAIVDSHDGSIRFESGERGTIFEIAFPAVVADERKTVRT